MWKNIVLVLLSFCLSIAAIEVLARFFVVLPNPFGKPHDLIVQDERGFWTLAPNFAGKMDNRRDFKDKTLSTDQYGGRTVTCRHKATGSKKIIVVGDSQSFGQGLSDGETWPSLIQCKLVAEKRSGRVYNLSVPSVNIDTYAVRLRQFVAHLEHDDHVIIGVTWNDLHTNSPKEDVVTTKRSLKEFKYLVKNQEMGVRPSSPLKFLHTPTWRREFYEDYGFLVPNVGGMKTFLDSMQFSSAAFHLLYPRLKELLYRLRPEDSFFKKLPEGTFHRNFVILGAMQELVKSKGAQFSVLFLPNRLFFDNFYYDSYSKNGKVFPAQDFLQYLGKKFCTDLSITCISAFPFLLTNQRDAHTFPFDGHYNERGARQIATGVFRLLFKREKWK